MVRLAANPLLPALTLMLLVGSMSAAQTSATGRLTGTVKDPSGAVIPGAEILAKNDGTGTEFKAITNETGVWTIQSVPSGSYTISVNAQSFRKTILREIKVDEGVPVTVDAILQVGLEDQIVVTASKFEEEVLNAPATATVIPQETIRIAPSLNVAELLRAVPGMNVIEMSARQFAVTSRSASGVMPSS